MKWPALFLAIPILAIFIGRATASGLSGIYEGVAWRVIPEWFGEGYIYSVELTRPGMEPYLVGEGGPWSFDTPDQAKEEAFRQIDLIKTLGA